MAELHIDDDWKKQAQEEKRRLAEEAEKRRQQQAGPAVSAPAAVGGAPEAGGRAAVGGGRGQRGARELPTPGFGSIVQSILTQALYYLGELSSAMGEGAVNLDMAKHQVDLLGVLEEKTKGNLSAEEQKILDAALYESRMRFINVAAQYVNPYAQPSMM